MFDAIPELTPGLPDNAQSVAASREVQLAAQPDVVLANGEYEVNPARGAASVADFEVAGAQVFILTAGHSSGSCGKDQPTIEQVYGDLITLGRIFGVGQQPGTRQPGSRQGACSSTASVTSTSAVRAAARCGSAIS